MTDRTLSAAALDALTPDDLTLIAELLRRDAAWAAGVYMSPSDVRHEAARLLDMLAAVLPMARRTEAAERKVDRLKDYIGKLHVGFVALREDSDPCGETFMFSDAANAMFDLIKQFSLTDTEKG